MLGYAFCKKRWKNESVFCSFPCSYIAQYFLLHCSMHCSSWWRCDDDAFFSSRRQKKQRGGSRSKGRRQKVRVTQFCIQSYENWESLDICNAIVHLLRTKIVSLYIHCIPTINIKVKELSRGFSSFSFSFEEIKYCSLSICYNILEKELTLVNMQYAKHYVPAKV